MKALWYRYLTDQGFEDQERGPFLTHQRNPWGLDFDSFGTTDRRNPRPEAKAAYFRWTKAMADKRFQSTMDKIIWECHGEGMSSRETARVVGIDQSWVVIKLRKIKAYLLHK